MTGPAKYAAHAITREPAMQTITRALKDMWPFAVGFGVSGYIFVNVARSVTDEDVKNSKFVNPKH